MSATRFHISMQIKNHKQETTVIFPLALFFSLQDMNKTGYFHKLTRSATRLQLRLAIIVIITIISIFSCDAMQLLITAGKWREREEQCGENPKTRVGLILRMIMEIAKEDNIKPVFSATVQND
jgi:hypothetical protein